MKIPNIKDLENCGYKCYKLIKYHYPEFFDFLLEQYKDYNHKTFSEIVYCYYNHIKIHPTCPVCGKPLRFHNFTLGYSKYCSPKCSNSDPNMKAKIKQSFLDKYGVENPAQSKSIQSKIKQTNLDRYGGVGFASKELMDKTKQTNLDKYGVENPFKSEEIKEKIKQTNLDKYGVEHPLQSLEIQTKTKQTNLDKYGVENVFQLEEIKSKIKQTNLDKYGVEHPLQSLEIQEKFKQTCLDRYGIEYYSQTNEFKKFMSENSEEITKKGYNTKKKNNTFNTSQCEQDVKSWLDHNNIEYKYQYKSELYPFACDFYFPVTDLYFEIQGSWVHGGHPYNSNSEEDINIANNWKLKDSEYYQYAASIWTKSDPYKRQIAKLNELNWHEIFSNNSSTIIEELKSLLKLKV